MKNTKTLEQIKRDADAIIEQLQQNDNTHTTDKNGKSLANTKKTNLEELCNLVARLKYGIIPDNFNPMLDKNQHTFAVKKNSRKPNNTARSEFIVQVDRQRQPVAKFFIEHNPAKKYPGGGFAQRVKRGYFEQGDDDTKYAIKVFKKDAFQSPDLAAVAAMRSAYCYKQLGRKAFSFVQNKKQYLVSEWINGEELGNASQQNIQSIPITRRIIMSLSLH